MVFTVVAWGFNFVALKLLYRHMSPAAVSLVRFFPMFLCLVLAMAYLKQPITPPKEDRWKLLGLGVIGMGIYMVFFLEGMSGSTPAEGAILLACAPMFTLLLACVFRLETFRGVTLVGGVIALTGVSLVVQSGNGEHGKLVSNLYVLIAALVWAFNAVGTRVMVTRYSPLAVLTWSMPGGLIVLLPYGVSSVIHQDWSALTGVDFACLAHVAFLAGTLGFLGFNAGVKQVGASQALLYQYTVAPVAAFFGWWVLGSTIQASQWLGVLCVLLGVGVASVRRKTSEPIRE